MHGRVYALAVALLRGARFAFIDTRGMRYVATATVLYAEDFELAVVFGDAYDVASGVERLSVADLKGNLVLSAR